MENNLKIIENVNTSTEEEMALKIINGKEIAKHRNNRMSCIVNALKAAEIMPSVAIIQVGDNYASSKYVSNKSKTAAEIGIGCTVYKFATTTTKALIELILELNMNDSVHGILVQLPLPADINEQLVMSAIHPDKDVDGFHSINVGLLHSGETPKGRVPCTANGVIELIKSVDSNISGKKAVVLGRSNIVGKPVARLLENENAFVTVCHSKTSEEDMIDELRRADIIVSAIGIPNYIVAGMVGFDQIIIDVGINRDSEGKMCGDIKFKSILPFSRAITPVPGGVGPMTISCLMENVIRCAMNQNGKGELYDKMLGR